MAQNREKGLALTGANFKNCIAPAMRLFTHLDGGERDLSSQCPDTEQLMIVDARDRPIGAADRARVHREGLLHRAIHILLFNSAGALYLQRRSASKDRWPGWWTSSCSGHVDAGEAYDQAARRELAEELGLAIAPRFVSRLPVSPETEQEFISLYVVRHDGLLHPNPAEIAEGRFWSPRALEEEIRNPNHRFSPSLLVVLRAWEQLKHDHAVAGESS